MARATMNTYRTRHKEKRDTMELPIGIMSTPAPILMGLTKFSKNRINIATRPDAWGIATVVSCGRYAAVISGANRAVDIAIAIGLAHMHNMRLDEAMLVPLAWSDAKAFSL